MVSRNERGHHPGCTGSGNKKIGVLMMSDHDG
jgi:hypothetical protein